MATPDLDLISVMAEHTGRHDCNRIEWDEWDVAKVSPKPEPCLPYRLAEALAAEQAKVMRALDEARRMYEFPPAGHYHEAHAEATAINQCGEDIIAALTYRAEKQ